MLGSYLLKQSDDKFDLFDVTFVIHLGIASLHTVLLVKRVGSG